jgi:archaellum component FlaG (FlaF/FlaG flagellin family)
MNKLLILLAAGLAILPSLQSADITLSNYSSTGLGIFGVSDNEAVLLGGEGPKGVVLGRMNVGETEVATMAAESNFAGLHEAFVPFQAASDPFTINSANEQGLLVAEFSASTRLSVSDFGGETIYVWIFKGSNDRTQATNVILAKLNATFPTDSESLPGETAFVFLRPDTATFLLGSGAGAAHDYQFPEGDGPLATLQMGIQVPVVYNLAPTAIAVTLTVDRGASKDGVVSGTDPEESSLTFSVVDTPTKGSVSMLPDGSYTYTSYEAETGNDSFTFRAFDGEDYSSPATVTVVIEDNTPPTTQGATLAVIRGQSASGSVTGADLDGDGLTFFIVEEPTKGSVVMDTNGNYVYTSSLGQTGDDSFTFRVFDGKDSSLPATVTLTITDLPPGSEAPVITITQLASGFVGSYYEFEVPIANAPQGNASNFSAKGLPTGLKMDKNSGVISGYPTKAMADKVVTLLAKNAEGDSGSVSVTITIDDVPAAAVGTFLATINRSDAIADGFGGRLNLTTSTKGSFTAKLQSGDIAYSAKGKLTITDGEGGGQVKIQGLEFTRKGSPTLTADLVFDAAEDSVANFQLTGTLKNPENVSTDVSGVRNIWTKTSKPAEYTGSYTYSLRLPDLLVGNSLYPQGDGFGALTVTDKGTATFVGKTADGKSFTVPTILGPQGHLPLFSPFGVKTSSLVAMPQIVVPENPSATVLNSIQGSVSWMKPSAEAKSKDRAYRAGFGAFDLALAGGMYLAPGDGGVVAGLADNGPTGTEANAWLAFSDGGLLVDEINTFAFTIMNKKDKGNKQTVIVPKHTPKSPDTSPNPNSVTFKLLSKPLGHFTGTFTIPNEVKSLVRKTAYQGSFVRNADGSFERVGFFLLAELPEGSEKLTTSPQNSGLIEILSSAPVQP